MTGPFHEPVVACRKPLRLPENRRGSSVGSSSSFDEPCKPFDVGELLRNFTPSRGATRLHL